MIMNPVLVNWAAVAIALIMFIAGLVVVCRRMKPGWGPYTLQALGLVLLVPTIIVLGVFGFIDKAAIATLLGGVAGYIFGRGNEPKDKPSNTGNSRQQPPTTP